MPENEAMTQKKINKQPYALRYYGRFYLSQGFTKGHISTNDCGPTCVAMMLNLIQEKASLQRKDITKQEVIERMPWYGRLPGWVPSVGGASAPWGLAAAFNHLARELGLPWQAVRMHAGSQGQINQALKANGLVSLLRFWEKGGAHWCNIVGLQADSEKWVILDPNPSLEKTAGDKKASITSFACLREDWERRPWWAACIGLKMELVVYRRTETRIKSPGRHSLD
jgi:hypothetical protein